MAKSSKEIKNIPEKIYLQLGEYFDDVSDFNQLSEVSWCEDKQEYNDVEYVRASEYDKLREEREEENTRMAYIIRKMYDRIPFDHPSDYGIKQLYEGLKRDGLI